MTAISIIGGAAIGVASMTLIGGVGGFAVAILGGLAWGILVGSVLG